MKALLTLFLLGFCGACFGQAFTFNDLAMLGNSATSAGSPAYVSYAATFAGDGQCWLERDANLTGNADGNAGTISVWVNFSGLDATTQYFYWGGQKFIFIKRTTNLIRVQCADASNTTLVQLNQDSGKVAALVAADGWHHVMASWDRSVDNRAHMYIDGTECCTITTFLSTAEDADPISYSTGVLDVIVGATTSGATPIAGCVSEFYLSYTYVDLSNAANRAHFYNASGPPEDLSSYNSPIIYLKGDGTGFTANSGGGGNFTKYGTTDFTSCTAP